MLRTCLLECHNIMWQAQYEVDIEDGVVVFVTIRTLNERSQPVGPNLLELLDKVFTLSPDLTLAVPVLANMAALVKSKELH